ncbi:exodeoxyribonuclease VII large subunit [Nannocystaceae bacterium ST9]
MSGRGIPFDRRPPQRPGAPASGPAGGPSDGPTSGGGEPARDSPPRARVLTVRAVVEQANRTLEQTFAALWVEGEVSNLVLARSGHAYFTLKDAAAALPTTLWSANLKRLRFRLEEGQRLRVYGRLGIYAQQGKFQLYAERVEPAGLGEQMLQLEQLKRKLAGEGLFASDRKRALPTWPRRIGVVTSPHGAAIHDILKVIRRRMPTPVLLSPAAVQGPEASYEMTVALRRLQRIPDIDVIIIGRGGGSSEDLGAFNNEGLARAIASCTVPVVSAVGHEVDTTLCDLVADRRAATPSQAGELVVPDRAFLLERLTERRARLVRLIERRMVDLGSRVHVASNKLERWGQGLVRREREHLQVARRRLEVQARKTTRALRSEHRDLDERLAAQHPRVRIAKARARLHELERRLIQAGKGMTSTLRPELARAAGKLDALSPLAVLARGYALVQTDEGELVREAATVTSDQALRVRLHRGELAVRVTAIHVEGRDEGEPES